MKKEYIKPTANVIELGYTGMLCNSETTTPETQKFDTPETEELPVGKGNWDGSVL